MTIHHDEPSSSSHPVPIEAELTEVDGVAVFSMSGVAGPGDLVRFAPVVERLRDSVGHVVIDLDRLTLVHVDAITGFLARLGAARDRVPLLLCCSRLSGRRLLRRCGAGRVGAVVGGVEEALRVIDPDRGRAPSSKRRRLRPRAGDGKGAVRPLDA